MSAADVRRHRMAAQFLTTRGPKTASELVSILGVVQAQDFPGAKWAIGQRLAGTKSNRAIEEEFTKGRILRTHVLRPTWHFVTPGDIRWMLALTAPRVRTILASYDRKLELDRRLINRSNKAIERALAGGNCLTRKELSDVLARLRIGSVTGQRLGHIVAHAELDALICSGPRRGKQFTYALLDERAPEAPPIPRDEALARLAQRYFETRGPATIHDFAWWSGLTIADAKRAVQAVEASVTQVEIKGRPAWLVKRSLPKARLTAHLLPNYDEYFIGHKDRSAIAERLGQSTLVEGGSMLISNVAVIDGELVGGWKRREQNDAVRAELKLLLKPTTLERVALDRAVAEHEKFWLS